MTAPPILTLVLLLGALALAGPAPAAKRYVCAPCGLPCDTLSFGAPGLCPTCGMALVEEGSRRRSRHTDEHSRRVAILVFTGAEILDFSGPYEMFGAAGCDVYTVAASKDPVTTAMGLTRRAEVRVRRRTPAGRARHPGGGIYAASRDEATLRYIKGRDRAHEPHHVGLQWRVHPGEYRAARRSRRDHDLPQHPEARERVPQDQGRPTTSATWTTASSSPPPGLSAGMDGALHVIARLFGTGYAEQVALGEEYDWKPGGGFARAALADHQIPPIELDDVGKWETVRTEGDRDHWDIVVSGHSKLPAADLMRRVEHALTEGKWLKIASAPGAAASLSSNWRFTGTDGKPWKGTLTLRAGQRGAR